MPIDYSGFAFPKGQPRTLEKHRKKVDAEAALKAAYAAVDARDGTKCRATGRPLTPGAVMPQMRLEHHHLAKRSTNKDKVADVSNILTLCAEAHQLVEAGVLEIEYGSKGADGPVRFHWNAKRMGDVKPPFKLLSKRRSQNKDADAA